eukprot:7602929-Pyramimonas_sp.AAC.1
MRSATFLAASPLGVPSAFLDSLGKIGASFLTSRSSGQAESCTPVAAQISVLPAPALGKGVGS